MVNDPRGGHTSGEVPYDYLPVISERPAAGYKPPTHVRPPVAPPNSFGRPTYSGVTVVTTIDPEPHMHVQFGLENPLPVLAYAVWSNGHLTPIFHHPARGQIRACGVGETGWALRLVPPTVAEPAND